MDCATEDCVAAQQTGKEGIVVPFFAGWGSMSEEEHGGFVDEGEEAEVTRMLAGRFVDE